MINMKKIFTFVFLFLISLPVVAADERATGWDAGAEAKRLADLEKNAEVISQNENSAANRALTGGSMLVVGDGLGDMLGGAAADRAQENAEKEMRALINNMYCDYGTNIVPWGTKSITIPNEPISFVDLRNDYMTKMLSVTDDKAALDMLPGIEAETVYEREDLRLYNNVSLGRQGLTELSLYEALTNPTSDAGRQWAALREQAKAQEKSGTQKFTLGIVGSVLLDQLVVNRKAPTNKADAILARNYSKPLQKLEESVQKSVKEQVCENGTSGVFPDCRCPSDKPDFSSGECMAVSSPETAIACPDVPNMANVNNACECRNGFKISADGLSCECPQNLVSENIEGGTKTTENFVENGFCMLKETINTNNTVVRGANVALPGAGLFKVDRYTVNDILPQTKYAFTTFLGEVKANQENADLARFGTLENECLLIIGRTDRTGSEAHNKTLSQNRANSIREFILSESKKTTTTTGQISAGLPGDRVIAIGRDFQDCETQGRDQGCIRVDVSIKPCDSFNHTTGV